MRQSGSPALLLVLGGANIAEAGFFGWGGFGTTSGLDPLDASTHAWQRAVAQSNASAVYSLPGRDITKPYPASPMDGWKLNITAVDLSPVEMGWDLRIMAPESLYTTVDPEANTNKTERDVLRKAGGKVIQNVDESWTMCHFVSWGGQSYEQPEKAPKNISTKPDGDCSPWMSDACIKALEKAAASADRTPARITRDLPVNPRTACSPPYDIPTECDGVDLDFGRYIATPELPIRYLTGSTTNTDGYEMKVDDEIRKDMNKTTLPANRSELIWKSMTSDFTAVLTVFAKYTGNSTKDQEPGFAHVSCIRPELSGAHSKAGVSNGKGDAKSGAMTEAVHVAAIALAVGAFMLAL